MSERLPKKLQELTLPELQLKMAGTLKLLREVIEQRNAYWDIGTVEEYAAYKQTEKEGQNRINDLENSLKDMVFQFCSDDKILYHSFMSAPEHAFNVLGIENGSPTEILWEKLAVKEDE